MDAPDDDVLGDDHIEDEGFAQTVNKSDDNVIRSELTDEEVEKMVEDMDVSVVGDTISINGQVHAPIKRVEPELQEAATPTNLEELVELYGEGTVFYAAVKDMQIRHNKLKMKRGRPPTVYDIIRDVYAAWGIKAPEPNSKGRG